MQTIDISSKRLLASEAPFCGEGLVHTNIRLRDYATTPLYNIKAVVQNTHISPSTLRAWERRYHMCRPQRSESGYRLYSERDVAVIRWLKVQVDAGMSISQAVAWLDSITAEAGGQENVVLPGVAAAAPIERLVAQLASIHPPARDFASLQSDLLTALLAFDERKAEQTLSEAFALYSVEEVGERLLHPVWIEIGARWRDGDVSVIAEHFGSNYLLLRLAALLRGLSNPAGAPAIWVGCAPGEQHEAGALLLAIYLRRAGYAAHYLGQNLDIGDTVREARLRQPAAILFSAATQTSARELAGLTAALARITPARPLVGYGGQAFSRYPELRDAIAGVYLGASAHEAVNAIGELLSPSSSARRYAARQ